VIRTTYVEFQTPATTIIPQGYFWSWTKTAYMRRQGRLLKEWGSLCHTHNLNDSRNSTKWSTIISLKCHYFLTESHCTLMCLSHLGKVFTIVMAEIRLLNYSYCRIGDLANVVTGPTITVHCARSAPYVGFSLSFQTAAIPCVCCTLYGDYCAQGSYLMTDVYASAC